MNATGSEALADGTLLLLVLLVASGVVNTLGRPETPDIASFGVRYVEDVRLAVFRTTMSALTYVAGGESIAMSNGTTVETFLRLEVHLATRGTSDCDFRGSNERVAAMTRRLVLPGWNFAISGGSPGGPNTFRIPERAEEPRSYFESGWTYPSLIAEGPPTRLSVTLWISPR